jgi:putative peptidoglycan lipid II flippase
LDNPTARKVFRLFGPRVLGAGVVQLNFWINTWLASKMADGSIAGLQCGFSLMLMAQAAIAQSVTIAAMPTFSAHSRSAGWTKCALRWPPVFEA